MQARLQPGIGVEQVAEAASAHLHLLAQARAEVEHAGAVRSAQPLLAGAGIGVAAQRVHVHGDRADALRAVEQHGHVDLRELRRRRGAADPAHVRAGHQPSAGADLVGDPRQRHFADRDAAQLARGHQRPEQARVLLIAGQDLVSGPQRKPGNGAGDALARAARERQVAGLASEQTRIRPAQVTAELAATPEVRAAAPLLRLALELLRGRLDRARGERPVGARVQIRHTPEHGELGAQRGEVHSPRE